jgi:hypothetical protein
MRRNFLEMAGLPQGRMVRIATLHTPTGSAV